jgi:hypothetical protein
MPHPTLNQKNTIAASEAALEPTHYLFKPKIFMRNSSNPSEHDLYPNKQTKINSNPFKPSLFQGLLKPPDFKCVFRHSGLHKIPKNNHSNDRT